MSNKHVNIKLRRGTAAEWTASNELLQLGEPGFEKDTRKLKIGDGTTLWNDLPYITPDFINIVSSGSIADLTTLQQNQIVEGTIVLTTDGVRWIYSGTGSKINEASYVQLADISPAWIQITSKPASLVGLADIATTAIGDFILATGNNTYQVTNFAENVDDRVGQLVVAGSGISVNYNDSLNSLTISTSGVSFVGHAHVSNDITNFNSSVSGLIPVKDIISGTGISVSSLSGIYTITSTGSGVLADQAASLVTSVFNKTGSPIPKMTAVYINGGQGDQPTISLAQASGESASSKTYGLTAETINNMSAGRVIVFGTLTGLNTDQFNPTAPTGDVNGVTLYLSPTTPGGLTTTKPSAPNHMVAIGTIIRTHQNQGVIEVRVQNGFELEELHNVAVSGVSNGQFLQYNSGSGLWLASSSGNFSSLSVDNLNFDNNTISSSSGNIIISPSGNGALQRDSGGDSRGVYAVDWQGSRVLNTRVASGPYSTIGGGTNNTSSGDNSTVGGGYSNTSSNGYSTKGGGYGNTSSGGRSTIGGGQNNTSSGYNSTIGGGFSNTSSGNNSTIGGGVFNTSSNSYSTVGGGKNNTSSNYSSTVGGGTGNTASGEKSTISGGYSNTASAYNSTVSGGNGNTSSNSYSTVGGGQWNTSSGSRSTIGGGESNTSSALYSTIGGGQNNTSSGSHSTVGGGSNNTASGSTYGYSTVGGGLSNTSSGDYSTVSGGLSNTSSGSYSTVSGGEFNTSSGSHSTIGGGKNNTSSALYSTVGGGRLNLAKSSKSSILGGSANVIAEKVRRADNITTVTNTIRIPDATAADFDNTTPNALQIRYALDFTADFSLTTRTVSSVTQNLDNSITISLTSNVGETGQTWYYVSVVNTSETGGSYSGFGAGKQVVGGGNNNIISGNNSSHSVISGGVLNTIVPGQSSEGELYHATIAGGYNNTIKSYGSVIGGGTLNTATGVNHNTIAGGISNTNSGYYSTIGGGTGHNIPASSSNNTIGGGSQNTASGLGTTVGGGLNNSALDVSYSFGCSTVGGGKNNTSSGNYSTVGGGRTNTSSAHCSTVSGGQANTASDENSTVGGGYSNTSSGYNSTIGGGSSNTSSNFYSTVGGGRSNTSSGNRSTVGGGQWNTSSGNYSTISGGFSAVADRYGMQAYAAGSFSGDGDSQRVDFVLRNITTNNTSTTLFLNGSDARLTIPSNKALFATINIAGIINGGSKAAHYVRKVAIKNVGGTTSLIGTVSTLGSDVEDDALYDVTITADNTNDALQINVTGKTGETIRWVAHVEGVEILYG